MILGDYDETIELLRALFHPQSEEIMLYGDWILKDGVTCKEWRPVLKHWQKAAQISIVEEFNWAKRRIGRSRTEMTT